MKQPYGTTKKITDALREAASIAAHSNSPEMEAKRVSYTFLADDLEAGRMILDPWEIEDVHAMTQDDDGVNTLTDEQAIEVLSQFDNHDYRIETGNDLLRDIASDLEAAA